MLLRVRRFFKTPKGLLTIVLAMLTAVAAPSQGVGAVVGSLAAAALPACVLDLFIVRRRKGVWEFPSGALLTAMIVSMLLRVQEPWWVLAATASIAVLSKYVFRSRTANVFNPAAFALIVSFYLFHTGQNWWGALVDLPLAYRALLLAGGLFIGDRVNKMPLALSFLGTYFALFTAASLASNPLNVAEIFRTPDAEAALYFACFILSDPPTSPAKYPDQIRCGILVAAVSFGFFELWGVVYFLLAGVMVGNVWEAWRRVHRRSEQAFGRKVGVFLGEVRPWGNRPGRAGAGSPEGVTRGLRGKPALD